MLKRVLSSNGYVPTLAKSGAEALNLLVSNTVFNYLL